MSREHKTSKGRTWTSPRRVAVQLAELLGGDIDRLEQKMRRRRKYASAAKRDHASDLTEPGNPQARVS